MGSGCSPKNLVALIRAEGQLSGQDIFTEAQRVKNFTPEQKFHYESQMARKLGLEIGEGKPKKSSAWDAIKAKTGTDAPKGVFNDRLYIRPSEQFSAKFYNPIDKKLQAWQAKGKQGNYAKDVAKPIRTVREAVDKIAINAKNKADLNKQLKPFGLTADNLYDARDYLSWLEKGGHTQKGYLEPFKQKAATVAKAQANFNLLWTLGNGVDMIRAYSYYATRKNGLKNVILATANALKAGGDPLKGGIFRKQPGLKNEGVYGSEYIDRGDNNNPFQWSITAQKNLVYHLDKAAGGDGHTGIRDQLFDSNPWDQPRFGRSPDANLVFGLARYPINETRWLYHTTKAALSGDKREAANLIVYHVTKAALVGVPSLIPAPVYAALSKDQKEALDSAPGNLIKVVSGKALHSLGIDSKIDLGTYTQPGGGSLGARAGSLVNTATGIAKYGTKSGSDLVQGKLAPAAINALAAGSALANFGAFSSAIGKVRPALQPVGEAFQNSVANSTTVTKLLGATAKGLEEEFNGGKMARDIAKALIGPSLKNDKSTDSGDSGRPTRSARPTRASRSR